MSINEIIIYIMVIFAALGALDRNSAAVLDWEKSLKRESWQSERCQSPWWESLPWLR